MNSNQMLVTFDEYEDKWQQCLTALEYDYTLCLLYTSPSPRD